MKVLVLSEFASYGEFNIYPLTQATVSLSVFLCLLSHEYNLCGHQVEEQPYFLPSNRASLALI